jgi:hypothetical protein
VYIVTRSFVVNPSTTARIAASEANAPPNECPVNITL